MANNRRTEAKEDELVGEPKRKKIVLDGLTMVLMMYKSISIK